MKGVADAIESVMERKNLSQAQVAKAIGIAPSSLHRWINGTVSDYSAIPLSKLCNLAGISLDQLLEIDTTEAQVQEVEALVSRISVLEKSIADLVIFFLYQGGAGSTAGGTDIESVMRQVRAESIDDVRQCMSNLESKPHKAPNVVDISDIKNEVD